jgi:hypothetical protein
MPVEAVPRVRFTLRFLISVGSGAMYLYLFASCH